tara:strand:+ start:13059 stop:14687 length:1629 start_codon:yes stop_codon:yes gene_type:complete
MGELHIKLLELRREIYLRLKKTAVSYNAGFSEDLKKYYEAQEAYENKTFELISSDEFLENVESSKIIYLGDFHTFDQSSKNFNRLIKFLLKQNKKLVIGLEMVSSKEQLKIDSFVQGLLTEKEFLEAINYKESWRFPWVHYSELFTLAREKNISIVGLNSPGPLESRDEHAANLISKAVKKDPNSQFLVLFGELHILPDKLPGKVAEKLNNPNNDLIVHQNLDFIYWKQLEESTDGRIGSSIVKIENNEFSLQNSPPWIKLESYVYWFENLMDDPDFDMHEYSIENSIKLFNENIYDNFSYLSLKICESLDLKIGKDIIDEFNLYDHQSLEYILKETLNSPLYDFYKKLIETNQFFQIINTDIYYCPSYSINRIVYLAGSHVFHSYTKDSKKNQMPQSKTDLFYYWTHQFCFSYFCTKIFNPYRKCSLVRDIKNELERINAIDTSPVEERVYTASADTLDQTIEETSIEELSFDELYNASKIIGDCLGDFIYSQYDQIGNYCLSKCLESSSDILKLRNNLNSIIRKIKDSSPNFYTKSKKLF